MIEESRSNFNRWQAEQDYLAEQKQLHPEFFEKKDGLTVKEQLSRIGIVLSYQEITNGFIKYYPFDFIVEEVLRDGEVITVDYDVPSVPSGSGPFLVFDLVKVGISTIDAIRELAQRLQIKETQIGYGGIKDSIAFTSQRLSVSGVTPEQLINLPESNFFIKNIRYSSEAISMNSTSGNRFTILIRTAEPIDEQLLESRLQDLRQNGFWNFYWLQRFGNRLLSHWWGLLLLQGKDEKAIRSYLCDPGPNELSFFSKLRKQANGQYENWEAMAELYKPLGFSFRQELILLNSLREFRHDYIGALRAIPDQAKMWIYAYGSLLFNKVLSFAAADQIKIGQKVPLLLSNNPKDYEIYEKFLENDRLPQDFSKNIRRFDFMRFTPRTVDPKLFAKIYEVKVLPEGTVISFDLPKGAYATAFLSHIFCLDGQILPQLKNTVYDLKELIGSGSITETKKKLEKYTVIRKAEEVE